MVPGAGLVLRPHLTKSWSVPAPGQTLAMWVMPNFRRKWEQPPKNQMSFLVVCLSGRLIRVPVEMEIKKLPDLKH